MAKEVIVCPFCGGNMEITYEENRLYRAKCYECHNTVLHEDRSFDHAVKFFSGLMVEERLITDCNDYQKEYMKYLQPELVGDPKGQIEYGVRKLAEEASEVLGELNKADYQGHNLDYEHLLEEVGDCLWQCCLIANAMDVKISEVFQIELEKCRKRYPEGHFSVERSVNRE